jgi:hypothetical protein
METTPEGDVPKLLPCQRYNARAPIGFSGPPGIPIPLCSCVVCCLRLPLQHFGRRVPIRPLLFAVNGSRTRPPKSLSTDADPVTDRLPATLYQVQIVTARIDDNCAGRNRRRIGHDFARKGWIGLPRHLSSRGRRAGDQTLQCHSGYAPCDEGSKG